MFYDSLKKICDQKGTTPTTVAKSLGLSNSIATSWKKGRRPRIDTVQKIADFLQVPVESLMDQDKSINVLRIPVYGQVAAGIPIEAIEDIEDYEEVDASTVPHGEYMALRIKGHSMEPRMMEGDVVIVRLQDDVDSGDTAVVLVNGGEATCKKIKKTPDGVILISTNPVYEPMFFSNQEIIDLPVRILGKVVELRAKY